MYLKNKNTSNILQGKNREKLVISQIVLTVLFFILAFTSCSTNSNVRKIANSKTTSVQLLDGRTIITEAKPGKHRSPEVIKDFTQQWYNLMLGWNTKDKPVKLDNKFEIPANSYAASQMMSTSLQKTFIGEYSGLINTLIAKEKSNIQSAPKIRYVSEPQQITNDTWSINIVADWIVFDSNQNTELRTLKFNKTLTVKATTIPKKTIAEENSLQNLILSLRITGLEITNIEEYEG